MMTVMNKKKRICRYLSVLVMLPWLSVGVFAAAPTSIGTLPVTATVTVGTCDVFLQTSDNAGGAPSPNADVSINAVDRIGLAQGGVSFGNNSVTASLSCRGINTSTGVPTITISGTSHPADPFIFKGTGSMDSRVGVVVSTVPQTIFTIQRWNSGQYIKPGGDDVLSLTPGADGSALMRTYYLGLSCGQNAIECASSAGPLTQGEIQAVLSLSFAYK